MSTSTTVTEHAGIGSASEEFRKLFNKYTQGRQWLTQQAFRGHDIKQDMDDFAVLVIVPMQKLWFSLPDQDKGTLKHELCPSVFEDSFD